MERPERKFRRWVEYAQELEKYIDYWGWNKIEDGLPDHDKIVTWINERDSVYVGKIDESGGWGQFQNRLEYFPYTDETYKLTHWRRINPPKKNK